MKPSIYIFGTLLSVACAILLLRGYARSRQQLLFWSGLCFGLLGVSNGLEYIDLVLLPSVDLFRFRLVSAAIAMLVMLYGLIWLGDSQS